MKIPAWRRYRELFRPDAARDLSDEVQFHIETETEELMASGLTPEVARRRALERFGDVDRAVAECRESDRRRLSRRRRARFLDALAQDLRYATRALLNQPAFTATVTVILALGIGANAAVFSVVDPLFFRMPAGVRDARQVKQIYVEKRPPGRETYYQARFSLPEARFIDSSIAAAALPSAIWFRQDAEVQVHGGAARPARIAWVTPTFLSVLGVRPYAGTDFDSTDAHFGVPASTAIISWSYWRRELAGDTAAVGRVILVAGVPVTIRAIGPEGFRGIDLEGADLWLPLAGFTGYPGVPGQPPWYESWGTIAFRIVARAPTAAAERQLAERALAGARAASSFITANPRPGGRTTPAIRAMPASLLGARGPDGTTQGEMIAAVLGAVSLLLLVLATANVGNLLLGRAIAREREIAVRLALGMSRRRLIGQVTIESMLLALVAAVAAMILAVWLGMMLHAMLLPGMALPIDLFDARVGWLALALGLAVGLLAAVVPLSAGLREGLLTSMKTSARDGGGRGSRARMILVGVQAALSVMLLVGTGLMGRSLHNIRAIDLGLDVDRVITVTRPDSTKGPSLEAIAAEARRSPGVARAVLSATQPLDDLFGARAWFDRNGDTLRVGRLSIGFVAAEPGYLDAVGTRLLRGRDLTANDRLGTAPVMVVSDELARRVWPGQNAIGQCLRIEQPGAPCYTVIGVAENAHSFNVVEDPKAVFYVTFDQRPDRADRTRALVIRTLGDPRPVADRLRKLLGDTIPSARRHQVFLMKEMLAGDYRPWEIGAKLFAGFSALALLLALFGLYGVLSFLIALRKREIGIRMALGADRRRVLILIVGEGVRHVSIGAAAGVVLAVLLSTRIQSLLYQVSARDPVIAASALGVLVGCAGIAALIPARRAMSIDPMLAIREE